MSLMSTTSGDRKPSPVNSPGMAESPKEVVVNTEVVAQKGAVIKALLCSECGSDISDMVHESIERLTRIQRQEFQLWYVLNSTLTGSGW